MPPPPNNFTNLGGAQNFVIDIVKGISESSLFSNDAEVYNKNSIGIFYS
jgi:hypothetical protein